MMSTWVKLTRFLGMSAFMPAASMPIAPPMSAASTTPAPLAARPAAMTSPMSPTAEAVTSVAETGHPRRASGAPARSSARPASSSPRVCRIAMRIASIAASTQTMTSVRQAVKPPAVVRSPGAPTMTSKAGVLARVTRAARLSSVGKSTA